MKLTDNLFTGFIVIIGIAVIAFNVLLYNSFEKQKIEIGDITKQQQLQAQVDNNQFKYQAGQIERLVKALEIAHDQLKDQAEALLQETQRRQQMENNNKNIQTALVDIKAETDAIKQDMKGWQKDYASVLAELEKKMDDSQDEIKSVGDNLVGLNIPELKENINSLKVEIEQMAHPPVNISPDTPPAPETSAVPDKKMDSSPSGSQS